MEQLININEISKDELSETDVSKLHWYALFIEVGKHLNLIAEWNRIKTLNEQEFKDIVVFWSPYWCELCDNKIKTNYYYDGYYFIGSRKEIDGSTALRFEEIPHCFGLLTHNNYTDKKHIKPISIPTEIPFEEMNRMFLLVNKRKNKYDFKIDQVVRIINGVLENYKGIIKNVKNKEKALIQVHLFNNVMTDVEIPLDALSVI